MPTTYFPAFETGICVLSLLLKQTIAFNVKHYSTVLLLSIITVGYLLRLCSTVDEAFPVTACLQALCSADGCGSLEGSL